MDARRFEGRTNGIDLSLRLGSTDDNNAEMMYNNVGPVRNTNMPPPLYSTTYERQSDIAFRDYPLQLNASDSLGLGQRTLERPPMLQQINGQINIGGASGSHFAANPIPGPVGLGNFSAPSSLAPPPPPVYYNIYGGPSFAAYPGFSAAMNMNQSISIPSFEGPLARQYDIGSSSNNSNMNNNNNYLYTDGNGLLMQRAVENDVPSVKPVRRCWNVNCNTTDTPMWRRGPFGPKTLCNACGIRYRKEEDKRKAQQEAATAATAASSNSMANRWLPPHFLM